MLSLWQAIMLMGPIAVKSEALGRSASEWAHKVMGSEVETGLFANSK